MSGKKNKGERGRLMRSLADRQASTTDATLAKLVQDGHYAQAEQKARHFLSQKPQDHGAKKALSAALLYQEKKEEAYRLCKELVASVPGDWECWANLAFVERDMGQWPAAFEAYNKALELNPRMDTLCAELARLYVATNQSHLALHWAFEALKLKPEARDYFLLWVGALLNLRMHEEALTCLKGAWEDERGDPELAVHLIPVACGLAQWDLLDEVVGTFRERFQAGQIDDLAPLALGALPGFNRRELLAFIRGRVKESSEGYAQGAFPSRPLDAKQGKSLRIGYLSADIFNHATTYLINGVLLAHTKFGLELYIYSYGPDDKGERRRELEAGATVFRDIQLSSTEQAAQQIANDEIDILVDLKGWTKDFRVELQALRPAPIVVSWLGYPGTLGHRRLADYIIGDPVVTPLEHADGYAELIAQMPYSYQPNDRRRPLPPASSREAAGLPASGFVFCSFNRVDKLTPTMLSAWCRILKNVPGAVLWLLADFPRAMENVRKYVEGEGVDPQRIVFAPSAPREEHLARLQCADLALDSFPYTAHTTGSDALWVGVPLLALLGDSFISRVSSSLVTSAGLPEMVMHNLEDFEATAIRLATEPAELSAIKARLLSGRESSPLFDTERFARDLAALYRTMWKNHIEGRSEAIPAAPSPPLEVTKIFQD